MKAGNAYCGLKGMSKHPQCVIIRVRVVVY